MSDRIDTGNGNTSLQVEVRRYAHSWFQYGAMGSMILFFYGVAIYLLHVFVPIYVHRFERDEATQTQQSAALQSIANGMGAMNTTLEKGLETIRGEISVASTKHR